jgi:hypothetical protein
MLKGQLQTDTRHCPHVESRGLFIYLFIYLFYMLTAHPITPPGSIAKSPCMMLIAADEESAWCTYKIFYTNDLASHNFS